MNREKHKKASSERNFYPDSDDAYFKKHFARLVREHGGEWIVMAEGKIIGIGKKDKLHRLVSKAQASYPKEPPFCSSYSDQRRA